MGIEDYNFLKSTLEEVATLRENRKKNRRDLKGFKRSLADLEQELPILRDNLEGVTSRAGNMPHINELEIKLMDLRGGEKTVEEERGRLWSRHSEAEKKVKESEVSIRNETIILFVFLGISIIVLTVIMGASPKFECENGESVNYLSVNDGEEACLDGSDERATAADAERADFVKGFCGSFIILTFIIVYAFDEHLKSKSKKDLQLINSQLDKHKDANRTRRSSTSKLEEQLRTRRSLKNDMKELPILIEECLKNIENAEMDIQRTIEEIRNISNMIEEKMTSISHLIPYSEFVPE